MIKKMKTDIEVKIGGKTYKLIEKI